jgi:methionyl-tRNA formyltransferase
MKIVYISYDNDGYLCLKEILRMGCDVTAVFTLADDLMAKTVNHHAFDDLAAQYGLPLYKVRNINSSIHVKAIEQINPDIIYVLGWSQLISKPILDIPKLGCIGVHPTLLPANRGRAPIPWAIINGLKKSGVTLFYMDEGVDSGDIVAQREFTIEYKDNAQTVSDKVSRLQLEIVEDTWQLFEYGWAKRIPQDHSKANYWPKRTPNAGKIDWNKTNDELYNWVRGLTHPYPGAFTYFNTTKLFVWEAEPMRKNTKHHPGTITEVRNHGMVVQTGKGCLLLKRLQLDGQPEYEPSKNHVNVPGIVRYYRL